jgi:alpha-ketoglutarate-dependent taurine dioxygenase
MSVRIIPIKPRIGSLVHADRRTIFDDDTVRRCQELLEERCVLVFPGIGLSDEEQLAFTDRMGARIFYSANVPGGTEAAPDIYRVTLDPEVNDRPDYVQSTFFWHTDGMHSDMALPKTTLLAARGIAPKGGQTEFANTIAAYEALPQADKDEIDALRVVHSIFTAMWPVNDKPSEEQRADWIRSVYNSRAPRADGKVNPRIELEHPLVYTDRSGHRSLLLGQSADHIVGVKLPDGRALLARLLDWAVQPDFHYRHDWQPGDLVMWNNPGALHRVIPYADDSGRAVHRTSIAGIEPAHIHQGEAA